MSTLSGDLFCRVSRYNFERVKQPEREKERERAGEKGK